MRLVRVNDVDGFFEAVNRCTGRVELLTDEGDRLNLKSRLCQYLSLADIFSRKDLPHLQLLAYEKEDALRLLPYITVD